MDELNLQEHEYAELARLVEAERAGDDVQYAAFSALCPTGEEGAFDGAMCDVYRVLHEQGFVDGESDGEAFYFSALTLEGRAYVEERELEAAEGSERALWQQGAGESSAAEGSEEEGAPVEGEPGKSAAVVSGSTAVAALDSSAVSASGIGAKLIAFAAAVGFVAGILGGAIGAYLVVTIM